MRQDLTLDPETWLRPGRETEQQVDIQIFNDIVHRRTLQLKGSCIGKDRRIGPLWVARSGFNLFVTIVRSRTVSTFDAIDNTTTFPLSRLLLNTALVVTKPRLGSTQMFPMVPLCLVPADSGRSQLHLSISCISRILLLRSFPY